MVLYEKKSNIKEREKMAAKVIQQFIHVCNDCPHCLYYSGGMHRCKLTDGPISQEDKREKVLDNCPLPNAGT